MSTFIAVVDDDSSVRQALTRLLRFAGYQTRAFGLAEEVLDSESSRRADCLVLDIHLGGGVNGFDVHDRLRAAGSRAPVIFITAYDDPVSRDRAARAGASAYLRKPFESADFIAAVRAAVSAEK